jgi:hypothetical protein
MPTPIGAIGWVIIFAGFLYRALESGHRLMVLVPCYRQMLEEGRAKLRHARRRAA